VTPFELGPKKTLRGRWESKKTKEGKKMTLNRGSSKRKEKKKLKEKGRGDNME